MGSGINQTNTYAGGPVASILLSHDRDDDDGFPGIRNPTIGNDRIERSQLTFSSLASGLPSSFPWQSSYCPTSSFLDSGFLSASALRAMDARRQTLYSLLDHGGLGQRTMSTSHGESLNQLQLERYNRFLLDSSNGSSRRSSDIDMGAGFVTTDPRAGTILPISFESSKRHSSLPVDHQIADQMLLNGNYHTDAGNDNAVSVAARAHQEFMLQVSQGQLGPTAGRFAGVLSRSSNEIGGGSRVGGLEKIDYTHCVPRAATSTLPPTDCKQGSSTTTPGCGGHALATAVRNNPPGEHDITNYHSHCTSSRGLSVSFRSDTDILSYHSSSSASTSRPLGDHPERFVNAASASCDQKEPPPKGVSMESHRKLEDTTATPSPRKHEAKRRISEKKSKPPTREGEMIPPRKRRRGGKRNDEGSATHCSTKPPTCRGKEGREASFLREDDNRSLEKHPRLAENLCMGMAAGREHHPQLRQIDEEQSNVHHAILADQESLRSRLLWTTLPVLPFPYRGSCHPYSTRALLDNVTSALFPPRGGTAALGSIGGMFGADIDHASGSRISQALPPREEQLPEETYSGGMERPYVDSSLQGQGQGYTSSRETSRGRCFPLHIMEDENNLSSYQVLARKQIEVFEASIEEAGTNAQGRNRPIQPGEIGIRCRHCAKLAPKDRVTGAVYYPKKLDGVYQTAQKMAVNHLVDRCQEIPEETKQRLRKLKDTTRSSDGGGKRYWAEALRTLGVRELESGGLVWNE